MRHAPRKARDLVLVGGGHAHVQVLKMLAMKAPDDVQVTLVSDGSAAFYSGMFPGCIAGLYAPEDAAIELRPLARWAGARFVRARVVGVDPEARRIELEGRPPLRFDVASVNVGSATRGLDLPGAAEFAVPTRPISGLLARIQAFEETVPRGAPGPRIVVVGAGAAGVELALTLGARFRARGNRPQVTLVDRGASPMASQGAWVRASVRSVLAKHEVTLVSEAQAARVEDKKLSLVDGRELGFDLLVWATGGAAPGFLAGCPLETDEAGFLRVHQTLQCVSSPRVFAAGDCVTVAGYPDLPKAGVYAVREGPVLADNLLRFLGGRNPRAYTPQSGFLSLLATGDGEALLHWKGLAARGAWAWRLKDWIDRRFMEKFDARHLGESPAKMRAMRPPATGEAEAMRCNGCGAKVGAAALREALGDLEQPAAPRVRLGLEAAEDGAVVEVPAGSLQVQTVDYFPAFLEDPYLVGRVAALHAASDLFAMGASPETALLILNLAAAHPRRAGFEMGLVVQGVVEELRKMGATLVGGHTTEAIEPAVGLTMTGLLAPDELLSKGGLAEGDSLILTKPLGTGAILAAEMRGEARGAWVDAAVASMLTSNQGAARLARSHGAVAVTDITGFGLAGHLGEMLRASAAGARLRLDDLPVLAGARDCLEGGVSSSLDPDNRDGVRDLGVGIGGGPREAILYDPQTSGGLLVGVRETQALALLAALRAEGYGEARLIGEVTEGPPRLDLL